jgi:hypothetical protein
MPIRKRTKDDFMSREMDERLSEMEASISNVYQQAVEETTARLNSYMEQYEEENRVMRARLLEGEITEAEYEQWARRNLLRTQQYSTTIDSLAEMLVNADSAAIALVNGELPYVVAESYNFTQFVGHIIADHEDTPNVSFQIYNAQSVQALVRDNPQVFPIIDTELDTEWNRTRLNREITQGIIQGSTIPQLATRLQRVGITDRNSAIRAARTSMTSAENMGRNESHRRITSQGINMVKRWSATYDARTRDTHRLLDDTTANEKGQFGEGILDKLDEPLMEYPADPNGAAAEVYNCRCRLNIVPPNYSREANAQAYERWMQENYPADYRALNEDSYFDRLHKTDEWTAEAQQRVDRRIERLREAEGQSEQPQPLFVPAQSVEEAQQRARDAGAIYSKFDGWDIGRANNALEAVERLPEDCRPRAVLDGRDTATITDRSLGRKASSWYGVTYDYRPFTLRTMQLGFDRTDYDGGQVVGLNVRTFKTLEQLTSAKVKTNDSYFANNGRYWFFNTRGEATAHHEMGHCLFNVRIAGNDSIRNEWESASRRWYNESTCDLIEKPEEAFAEAWAAVAIGDEERLPSYIADFVRRYL